MPSCLPLALTRWSEEAHSGTPRISTRQVDGHAYRDLVATAPMGIQGTPPAIVAIAVNIDHQGAFLAALSEKVSFVIVVGAVLTALLGWVAARRGLAPVYDLAAITRRISAARMDARVPLDTVPHELQDLANAFNDMLARLADSFRRLSDFSSDLAHEIRTPISNLIIQAEVALSRSRSADEYRDVLYSSLEEYRRLARMTSDMLFLAKTDHGMTLPRNEEIDLAAETGESFDYFAALAEERGITLALHGRGSVRGDRLMIRRAISNLLSNAIRHTPQGGSISVHIRPQPSGAAQFVVENPGARIAPEHLPRLFDRFYRIDPSRQATGDGAGAGLGLAITKSIVEAHRGTIEATSSATMTRFVITFPATPRSVG